MIINREIFNISSINQHLEIISYVDKDGLVKTVNYPITNEEWFDWQYTGPKTAKLKDPVYSSWDYKGVYRKYQDFSKRISENREHEILCERIAKYPELAAIYELNIPITGFVDIEVEVDESGFPDPYIAKNPITTIAFVCGDQITVFGRAQLDANQIEGIIKKIEEHTKKFKTKYVFTYKYFEGDAITAEYNMLEDFFINYFNVTPAITGWNFFGFDWPYLLNRYIKHYQRIYNSEEVGKNTVYTKLSPIHVKDSWYEHKINGKSEKVIIPKHKVLFDYLEIYTKWDRTIEVKENSTLDFVASAALDVTKVKHSLGFTEMWEQEPDNYVFYNAIDSVLVKEIDQKIKTAQCMYGIANLTHVDLLNNISPVRTLEIVQCEYALMENRVFPAGKKRGEKKEYEGAFVYPTVPGIYKNIMALDFNSLYPSTQRQFNISPDTFVCKLDKDGAEMKEIQNRFLMTGKFIRKDDEIITVSGAVFKRNQKGILPSILTAFYAKRKVAKKQMMQAQEEMDYLQKIVEERTKSAAL